MIKKKLYQGAIGTGSGTLLYTVPVVYGTEITDIDVCNTTSGAISFTLHLVPVGISVAASNQLFPATSIAPNSMVKWEGSQLLNAGDFIQGIGSVSGLTVNITGNEMR